MRENKNSKLLSALLAILMIFSMLPVTTFAEEEMILQEDPNQIVEENQVEEIPEEEILEEVEEAPEEQIEELIVEEKQIEEIIEVVESPQPVVENLEEFNPLEEVEETIEETPDIEEIEQINSLEEPVEEVKEEIQVEETGVSNEVPVVKEVKHDSVTILSVNENDEELIGTEFAVYSDIENLETSIIKTISAATFTLSTIDEDLKDFLPVEGSTTLYLKETKVPEGYTEDTEIYKITIQIEVDEENNTIVYGLAFDDGQKELRIIHEPVIETTSEEEIEVVEEAIVLGATAFRTLPYNLNPEEGKILIPFRKEWSGSGDTEATRPSSITISLYKYLGASFDATTATLVDTKLVTAAEGWACEFDISKEELYSGSVYNSDTAYKWVVVESEVIGYKETGHVNPSVEFNPPEVAGGGWDRTTPCSEISITSSGHDKSVVCAKKGSTYVIWSVDPLSSAERELIFKSAAAGIKGFGSGNINNCTFISGFGSSSEFGMTITENSIQFNDTSNWSFYALGIYNKSSTLTNASSITNTYLPKATTVTLPVTKTIEGTPPTDANFDFVLTTLTENAPMPVSGGEKLTITGEGTGNFGAITYTMPGTWKYSVYEKAGGLKSYGYDDNIYKVIVTVNDVGGELVASVAIEDRSGASVDKMEFNNLYLTGDLIVQKIIAGNAASTNKEYNFKVELSDTSINGLYGDMTFVNGIAVFTLNGGERVFAKNLPAGVKYTVTEDDYSSEGYVTTKTNYTGVITYNNEIQATFTNTRNADGSLTILKKLAGNDINPDDKFTFFINLNDDSINTTYGGVKFIEGQATVDIKGNESLTINGIPHGTNYTVTERDYREEGYVTTYINKTGTISENNPAIVEFTNTRNTYGDLIVEKKVGGNAADTNKAFNFMVTLSDTNINGIYGDLTFHDGVATFELKDGERKIAKNLPNGVSYKVEEDNYTDLGYETMITGEEGTITGGNEVQALFINYRDAYGSLIIKKHLAGNDINPDDEFTFFINLNNDSINTTYGGVEFIRGQATVDIKGNESLTINGIPHGTSYTVTEHDYSREGYVTTSINEEGTINEHSPAIVEFTNTRNTYGDLIVHKRLAGNAANSDQRFLFTVTLSDTTISDKFGDMIFENGVAKFELSGGESKKAEDLPNGITYKVVEDDYSSLGYVTTKTHDTGTITGNEEVEAIFTNTRDTYGSLEVSKVLTGNDVDTNKEFNFTIKLTGETINGTYSGVTFTNNTATIKLKGGEYKVIEGLPNGIRYDVSEDNYYADGYFTSKTGATGTIVENEKMIAEFVNSRNTYGSLIVEKKLEGNAPHVNKSFSFTVTLSDTNITAKHGDMVFENGIAKFELKGGEKLQATRLPNGLTYTVSEKDYTDEGYITTKYNDTGTIVGNKEITVTFVNERNATGSLIISKKLDGNDPNPEDKFKFTIELTGKPVNSNYSGVIFTDNKATLELKGGESKQIDGLPNGITYTVLEDSYREQGYFTMTTDSFTGQIDENKPAEVVYINIRDTFGDLTVKKVLAGNATDANKAFNFTVILSDTSITDGYGSMKFIEGKATFTLKGGEEIKAIGLPNGVTYTVIEDDYSAQGYKTTKTNDTGKIVGNSEKVVTFTNTRNVTPEPPKPQQDDKPLPQYGSLIITKRVTGDLAEYDKYFSFKVTFNVDGSYYYDGVRTGNLKSGDVIQLKHDESITIYGLPDGTKYTVTEIGNNGYRVYASGNSGTISAINIATASFTNVRSKAPITGDITNLPLWLGSSILSGLGLLFIVFYRRKRNK